MPFQVLFLSYFPVRNLGQSKGNRKFAQRKPKVDIISPFVTRHSPPSPYRAKITMPDEMLTLTKCKLSFFCCRRHLFNLLFPLCEKF